MSINREWLQPICRERTLPQADFAGCSRHKRKAFQEPMLFWWDLFKRANMFVTRGSRGCHCLVWNVDSNREALFIVDGAQVATMNLCDLIYQVEPKS